MTNGQVTKKILAAAKTQSGSQLLDTAKSFMMSFPLSSEKLLYDDDKSKVPEGAWGTLLLAAVETDKVKLEDVRRMEKSYGFKELSKSFGRARI